MSRNWNKADHIIAASLFLLLWVPGGVWIVYMAASQRMTAAPMVAVMGSVLTIAGLICGLGRIRAARADKKSHVEQLLSAGGVCR